MLKTLDQGAGLVNGARGVVIGFTKSNSSSVKPRVRFANGEERTIGPVEWSIFAGSQVCNAVKIRHTFVALHELRLNLGSMSMVGNCDKATDSTQACLGLEHSQVPRNVLGQC